MRKYWTWAVLLAALLLVVACRPPAETDQEGRPEATAAEEVDLGVCPVGEPDCADENTVDQAATEISPTETAASPTLMPTPAPTATAKAFDSPVEPPDDPLDVHPLDVRDTDWTMGSGEPLITLLEYGDYL
jgi:hypothetical protein